MNPPPRKEKPKSWVEEKQRLLEEWRARQSLLSALEERDKALKSEKRNALEKFQALSESMALLRNVKYEAGNYEKPLEESERALIGFAERHKLPVSRDRRFAVFKRDLANFAKGKRELMSEEERESLVNRIELEAEHRMLGELRAAASEAARLSGSNPEMLKGLQPVVQALSNRRVGDLPHEQALGMLSSLRRAVDERVIPDVRNHFDAARQRHAEEVLRVGQELGPLKARMDEIEARVQRELSRPSRIAAGREKQRAAGRTQKGLQAAVKAELRVLKGAGLTANDLDALKELSLGELKDSPYLESFKGFNPVKELARNPHKVAVFVETVGRAVHARRGQELERVRRNEEFEKALAEAGKTPAFSARTIPHRDLEHPDWLKERILRELLHRGSIKHAIPAEYLSDGVPREKLADFPTALHELRKSNWISFERGHSGNQVKLNPAKLPEIAAFTKVEGQLLRREKIVRPRKTAPESQNVEVRQLDLSARQAMALRRASGLQSSRARAEMLKRGEVMPAAQRKKQRMEWRGRKPKA